MVKFKSKWRGVKRQGISADVLNRKGRKLYGYQVMEIKDLAAHETEARIARQYKVSTGMVNHIKNARLDHSGWRDLLLGICMVAMFSFGTAWADDYKVKLLPTNPMTKQNLMAVNGRVNNGVGVFIIDTGATYTALTPQMAKRAGIVVPPDAPTLRITTANGVIYAPQVTLENLTIGGYTAHNVTASIIPLKDDPLLAGIIGLNFFKGRLICFDGEYMYLMDAVRKEQTK